MDKKLFCPMLEKFIFLNIIINKLNISFPAVYSEVNKMQVFALKYYRQKWLNCIVNMMLNIINLNILCNAMQCNEMQCNAIKCNKIK